MIQYADDTIIILSACPNQAMTIKDIPSDYASSIGLKINFHKSTSIPIICAADCYNDIASIFSCKVGSMPFTYLGLPLVITKPTVQDLMPLVCTMERRMTSTLALTSYDAKLSLLNTMITSLTIFALCTLKFPPKILELLDNIRRKCLWTKKTEQGDKCNSLAAWDMVCQPKQSGGLGIINLRVQSEALLLKYLLKFYNHHDLPLGGFDMDNILHAQDPTRVGSMRIILVERRAETHTSISRYIQDNCTCGRHGSYVERPMVGICAGRIAPAGLLLCIK